LKNLEFPGCATEWSKFENFVVLPQLNKEQEGFGLSQSKQKGKDG
jgi:hypothetical protein